MTDFDLKIDSETGQLYAEDPETGDRQPVPFDEIDVNNAGVGSLDANSVSTEDARITRDEQEVFHVPTDYDTLNEAVIDLASRVNLQALKDDGAPIQIMIESGHAITEGTRVENGNTNYLNIRSEDDEVPVAEGFSDPEVFRVGNAGYGPQFGVLFDCAGNVDRGFTVNGGRLHIDTGAGAKNANNYNLDVSNGSNVSADGGVFEGAGIHNCRIRRSLVELTDADIHDAIDNGLNAQYSVVFLHDARVNNNGDRGVSMRDCVGRSESVTCNDNGNHGYETLFGGDHGCRSITANNNGGRGVSATQGPFVDASDGEVTGNSAGNDLYITRGGRINANDCETTNGDGGLEVGDTTVSTLNELTSDGFILG